MNDKKNIERIKWIDITKGIAMIGVLLLHSGFGKLSFIFDNFFMAVFFFISGYTFKYNESIKIKEFINKKFNSLIIPYIIFSFILYMCFIIISLINRETNIINYIIPFLGIIYSRYYIFDTNYINMSNQTKFLAINNSALWFLTCLFITYVIFFTYKEIIMLKKLWITYKLK